MQRYKVEIINNKLIFNDQDIHHIKNVMRRQIGDHIVAFCDGVEYLLTINSFAPFTFTIVNKEIKTVELTTDITLLMASLKKDNWELVLAKAVELGVNKIGILNTKRVIKKIDEATFVKKQLRWNKIIKEASEQCGRTTIPQLLSPLSLVDVKNHLSACNLVAQPGATTTIFNLANAPSYTLLVGPEGGFSADEIAYFDSLGFIKITLGKRILRAETAAITMTSGIMLKEDK